MDYVQLDQVYEVCHGEIRKKSKKLLCEEKLTLYINGKEMFDFVCTPKEFREMAVGYLVTEGKIEDLNQIQKIELGQERISVILSEGSTTGTFSKEKPEVYSVDFRKIYEGIHDFYNCESLHEIAGGSHKAVVFCKKSKYAADDVSRRAALEKAIGKACLAKEDLTESFVVFSGRVPKDIMEKIARARIPMLIARSSPTKEAVDLAKDKDIILCANIRSESFLIYHGKERLHLQT